MLDLTWITDSQERRESFNHGPLRWLRFLPFITSVLALALILYDLGFNQEKEIQLWITRSFLIFNSLAFIFLIIRQLLFFQSNRLHVWLFDVVFALASLMTIVALLDSTSIPFFRSFQWLFFLFLIGFLREFSSLNIEFKRSRVTPAKLFLMSFFLIIMVGAGFLMFPTATVSGISFIDALFTSTSAVCVTGLTIAETATYFTPLGQLIILFLIQIGGLGIMTFTSYFSYYFRGESSYENQLMIQAMTGTNEIVEVFGTLKRVLLITFIIEATGALLIYCSLSGNPLFDVSDKINFAVFHAVSAFCNAGFSTMEQNLANPGLVFEYDFQLSLSVLIILGGMGFPILYNFWTYFKKVIIGHYLLKRNPHSVWVINLSTRIIAVTTLALIVLGMAGFYLLEYNHVLSHHTGTWKVIHSFFTAVTVRTAGFNTFDFNQLSFSAVMLCYLLMWVGASPASTGGGIKTSTFAISIMNTLSIARGKKNIEVFGREISDSTVRRAYSQIFLSIFAIGVSVSLVSYFDKSIPLRNVIFECISAFSTCGLSMGITPHLTPASKLVLVLTMYVGRVNLLMLMSAIFKQVRHKNYRYPSEDISIN